MFGDEMLCCAARLICFQARLAGSTGFRPSRKASEYVAGRVWSGLNRVTSLCQSVPATEPCRYAMPATNHVGGAGGGMIVNDCVVDAFCPETETVSFAAYVTEVAPGVTYVCVTVWPVAAGVPSPKSHVYESAVSLARKLIALPDATCVARNGELSE